jgi:hypothetical protein
MRDIFGSFHVSWRREKIICMFSRILISVFPNIINTGKVVLVFAHILTKVGGFHLRSTNGYYRGFWVLLHCAASSFDYGTAKGGKCIVSTERPTWQDMLDSSLRNVPKRLSFTIGRHSLATMFSDLTTLYFSLWMHLKSKVHSLPLCPRTDGLHYGGSWND